MSAGRPNRTLLLQASLAVDFDDVCSKEHATPRWSSGVERRKCSSVPAAARSLLRNKIVRNDFRFQDMLTTVPGKLPVASEERTFLSFMKVFRQSPRTPEYGVRLTSRRTITVTSGKWVVHLEWEVSAGEGAVPSDVDLTELRRRLVGVFSDGWGEGVEQMRFGPKVSDVVDGDMDRTPRYSFNLTTRGAKLTVKQGFNHH